MKNLPLAPYEFTSVKYFFRGHNLGDKCVARKCPAIHTHRYLALPVIKGFLHNFHFNKSSFEFAQLAFQIRASNVKKLSNISIMQRPKI